MNIANANPRRSPDLSELDDDAYELFMAELLADMADQRRAQVGGLPRLMPMQPVAAWARGQAMSLAEAVALASEGAARCFEGLVRVSRRINPGPPAPATVAPSAAAE